MTSFSRSWARSGLAAVLLALGLWASADAQPNTPPGAPNDGLIPLEFPNTDVRQVIKQYEELTGKIAIIENSVAGNVYIMAPYRVPKDEAIRIIETNLLMNGYTIIPAGERTFKVTGLGKNARSQGVPFIASEDELPDTEQLVSYLVRLRYADAEETFQAVSQYIPFGQSPGGSDAVMALPRTQAILVTAPTSVIRKVLKFVEAVDVPPAEVESVFIELKRADAKKVLEQLKEIFDQTQQQQTKPSVRTTAGEATPEGGAPPPNVPQPPPTPQAGNQFTISEDSFVQGRLKIIADERTNRIHVITRKQNLPFIVSLVRQLDSNVDFGQPVRRPLRFVTAGEVLPVLVEALTEPGQEASEAGGGRAGGSGASASTGRPGGGGGAGGGAGGAGGGGSGLNVSEGLSTEPVETEPEAVTIGNTRLIADKRSNAIIVLGTREAVEKVFRILNEIDIRAPQVMFNVVIGEMTLNKAETWGIDLLLRLFGGDLNFASINVPGVARDSGGGTDDGDDGDGEDDGADLTDVAATFAPLTSVGAFNGLSGFFSIGNTLDGFVRALEATNRFKVISRPTVFTQNNKKAIIASGEEVAVPVSSTSSFIGTGDGAQPITNSNIEFKKIVLQLEVVPLINSENEVTLDILQQIDSISGSTIIDGNSIPTIATRYLRTNVNVPNRSTIFLGGLIIDDKRRDSSGIPGLSRIPILGYLFGGFDKEQRRRELIIMITPTVTNTPADLQVVKGEIGRDYILHMDLEKELVPAKKEQPPPDLIPLDSPYPKSALEAIQDGEATPQEFGWQWAPGAEPYPGPEPSEPHATAIQKGGASPSTKPRGQLRQLQPRKVGAPGSAVTSDRLTAPAPAAIVIPPSAKLVPPPAKKAGTAAAEPESPAVLVPVTVAPREAAPPESSPAAAGTKPKPAAKEESPAPPPPPPVLP